MTDRLEKAIRELSEADLAQLTEFAEQLARSTTSKSSSPMMLGWVGALKDGPYRSGMEAQEAAKHYRAFLLERSATR